MDALERGNPQAIKTVFAELDRLESLVRTYELVLETAMQKLESPLHKMPDG